MVTVTWQAIARTKELSRVADELLVRHGLSDQADRLLPSPMQGVQRRKILLSQGIGEIFLPVGIEYVAQIIHTELSFSRVKVGQ